MAFSVHGFPGSLQPWRKVGRLYSPRASQGTRIVGNRLNSLRTAFLAGCFVVCASGAGGQSTTVRDPSIAQKPLTPLSASDAIVHKGLFTIDVTVTDAAGNSVSNLQPGEITLLDNGQPANRGALSVPFLLTC